MCGIPTTKFNSNSSLFMVLDQKWSLTLCTYQRARYRIHSHFSFRLLSDGGLWIINPYLKKSHQEDRATQFFSFDFRIAGLKRASINVNSLLELVIQESPILKRYAKELSTLHGPTLYIKSWILSMKKQPKMLRAKLTQLIKIRMLSKHLENLWLLIYCICIRTD